VKPNIYAMFFGSPPQTDARDVNCWHFSAVPTALSNGGYRGVNSTDQRNTF
jgi:hypothetical protein